MRDPDKQKLSGGNSTPVVRVGKTVRRATGPWSPAVHDLLRHLEKRGFDGAPRFLRFDDQGREILTFIPGEVGNYPLPSRAWSEETLVNAARLLRRYHDATIGFVSPDGAVWRLEVPPGPREVICHNDFAPYNVVFSDGEPGAIIDFDTAGPGPRIWDVAHAAYRFVPLCRENHARSLGLEVPWTVLTDSGASARPTVARPERPASGPRDPGVATGGALRVHAPLGRGGRPRHVPGRLRRTPGRLPVGHPVPARGATGPAFWPLI